MHYSFLNFALALSTVLLVHSHQPAVLLHSTYRSSECNSSKTQYAHISASIVGEAKKHIYILVEIDFAVFCTAASINQHSSFSQCALAGDPVTELT